TGRPDEQYEETLAWAQKRVPGARVYLSGGKGNPYAANEGRDSKEEIACRLGAICLIDDNVGEFLGWDWSCSILPVCFAQPWNQSVPPNVIRCNWQQITRLLTSRLTGRP
ncbi:MAG: hypothetical protein OEV37_03180, partial [Candidatus Berkelbacteria bacterium]|nr:hypothetical protein [Candidatus Berkelbacteria bacterium]